MTHVTKHQECRQSHCYCSQVFLILYSTKAYRLVGWLAGHSLGHSLGCTPRTAPTHSAPASAMPMGVGGFGRDGPVKKVARGGPGVKTATTNPKPSGAAPSSAACAARWAHRAAPARSRALPHAPWPLQPVRRAFPPRQIGCARLRASRDQLSCHPSQRASMLLMTTTREAAAGRSRVRWRPRAYHLLD